ncbi:MAG: hypothetical protein DRK00_03910 [Thermoprotei archaeon]|nr:MAG: hypothetical protein DRK00_03910 [Thermoprotei archaeon]
MRLKAFSFEAKASEPRPLDVRVDTRVYEARRGRAVRLRCDERPFSLDDALDFDLEFGDTLQLTYADVVHGTFSCRVLDCDAAGDVIVKVLDARLGERRVKLFIVLAVEEGDVKRIYADRITGLGEWQERAAKISRLSSLPPSQLEAL